MQLLVKFKRPIALIFNKIDKLGKEMDDIDMFLDELGFLQMFKDNRQLPVFFVSAVLKKNFEYLGDWLDQILGLMGYPKNNMISIRCCSGVCG